FSVAAFGMPTGATALAGVGWIDQIDLYARASRLVADQRPQLSESPIAVSRSLPWPCNPRPLANTAQIFERNRPLRAFGFGNGPFADVVVRIFLKAPLTTCKPLQMAPGRLCSDLLESLTARLIPLAAAFNVLTRKRLAVAVGCQIHNAQINTQNA